MMSHEQMAGSGGGGRGDGGDPRGRALLGAHDAPGGRGAVRWAARSDRRLISEATDMDSKQASQVTTGLVVVAIGLMLLAGQLDADWGWTSGGCGRSSSW